MEGLGQSPWYPQIGTYIDLLLRRNDNVEELDYGCRPSSTPIVVTDRCEVYRDDEGYEDKEGDDKSDGDEHVLFFLTIHQVMENEQGRYVSVDVAGCNVSNNPDLEELEESSPVQYHLASSPQFENVENFGNVVSNY